MSYTKEIEEYRQQAYLFGRYYNIYKADGTYDQRAQELVEQGLLLHRQSTENPVEFLMHMMSRDEVYDAYDREHCPILIYKSDPICYGVLNGFADEIANCLDAMGYLVELFELVPGREEELLQFAGLRFRAVLGIQTYAFSIRFQDGSNLHDRIKGPKINLIFDHPIWLKQHLENGPKDQFVITHDKNYVTFIEEFFPEVKKTFWIPPGGSLWTAEEKKEYSLTFVGSYHDPALWQGEYERAKEHSDGIAEEFMKEAGEHLHWTWERSLGSVIEKRVRAGAMEEPSPKEFRELLYLCKPVCFIVMCRIREQIIEEILNSGQRLHVFGDSWKCDHWEKYPNLICHPAVSPEESLCIYRQSKLSLNIMSWHKDSMTERIANMMMNHCVVVTDESGYLVDNYKEDRDMLLFDLEKIDRLPQLIHYYLTHEDERCAIEKRAYQKALSRESWERRTAEILRAIEISCKEL
ncbi:Glycosyl transferases group 1 [Lachnospiraceae bacterium KHCPX20]|nr:Glycosyl transferases group 1 [Lachnospiraceae bacterium KHCPX20]